jgi:ABC-type branched-subunit amino acid transport system ATPase component/branched-subunit amino acid ABC-type transport system permease component
VLNFALGAFGGLAAFVSFSIISAGEPYWLAVLAALVSGAAVAGLSQVIVVRKLRMLPPLTTGMATLGILLVIQGLIEWHWGYETKSLPVAFGTDVLFSVGPITVTGNDALVILVALVASGSLLLLFAKTKVGLAMRAMSAGPRTASMLGINIGRLDLAAWAIGGAAGAIAALLVVPETYLDPYSFTTFLFAAFVAIVLGGFTSIGGVMIGGVVYGIGLNLLETYISAGLSQILTFILVGILLIVRPTGLFGRRERQLKEPVFGADHSTMSLAMLGHELRPGERRRTLESDTSKRSLMWSVAGCGILILAVGPWILPSGLVANLPAVFATFIAVLGLTVLAGQSGQLSIGHGGFLAVGAYTSAILVNHFSIPMLPALLAAPFAGIIVATLLGIIAVRLAELYLALLTLLFAFALPEVILRLGSLTGATNGIPLMLPSWLESSDAMYWFVALISLAAGAATMVAVHSSLGRRWRIVRDSDIAARSIGIGVSRVRLSAFIWSGALGALGGAILAATVGEVSPDEYSVWLSIYLVVAIVVGGSNSVLGALLGAAFITLWPLYGGNALHGLPPDASYGLVLLVIVCFSPAGLASLVSQALFALRRWSTSLARALAARRVWRQSRKSHPPLPGRMELTDEGLARGEPTPAVSVKVASHGHPAKESESRSTDVLLSVSNLNVSYGGATVLREVCINVKYNELVTLIGANGAGKTTLLRAISGVLPAESGSILLAGKEMRGLQPHRVCRMGIAHVPEGRGIFPDLTVEENVRLGYFGVGNRGGRAVSNDLGETFDRFPILATRRQQIAGTLSGGEQQMLALGRALLARPRLLMLDEPSLGLAPIMVDLVFEMLLDIKGSGVAMLLIEQNARMALGVADRAYVMSSGAIQHEGRTGTTVDDELIRQAYLIIDPQPGAIR